MRKEYIFIMFALCFFVWAIVVDNVVVPRDDRLRSDTGIFTRYRLKEAKGDGKLNLIPDEALIYAHVTLHGKQHEQLYYFDRGPHFDAMLKRLPPGTTVELRYARAFPKVWKRKLYDMRVGGSSVLRHSSAQLAERQKFVWRFTAIMAGAFVGLSALGFLGKPRKR